MSIDEMKPWIGQRHFADIINTILQGDGVVLEYGSGWSTIQLLIVSSYLVSVEHDKEWYGKVSEALAETEIPGQVKLVHYDQGEIEQYVRGPLTWFGGRDPSVIIIDGSYESRPLCFEFIGQSCKAGTHVFLHDSQNWKRFSDIATRCYETISDTHDDTFVNKKTKMWHGVVKQ